MPPTIQSPTRLRAQLKDALHRTSANWAVLVRREDGAWIIDDSKQLLRTYQESLKQYLARPEIDAWLCKALDNDGQSVSIPSNEGLKSAHLFAYPASGRDRMILVGAEKQSNKDRLVWQSLASGLQNKNGSSPSVRARGLDLVHEVAQQVIGLDDKREIAQITAELLARTFDRELTVVLLSDKQHKLTIHGFGGRQASGVREAVGRRDLSSYSGITGRVLLTGESMLVNNARQNKLYERLEGWNAGSEICVPLKENGRVFGIINIESPRSNAFTHGDLVILESLAGILAVAVSGVEKYQRLQEVNRQLRQTQIELKARMEAQRAAENRLIQNARLTALGEMVAGIAHELNNPLTTITGFAELIVGEIPKDAEHRKELEMILNESRRAGDVIRRLLEFSRQREQTRTRVDVNGLVEDVIALARHLIHAAGVQLTLDPVAEIPWVYVDRDQIKQALLNLIHNALQAMPNGGKLYLSTSERSRDGRKWAVVSVRDTGVGIAPKDRIHIFEPFFSARSGVTGIGLGLSVAYGVITDHGGMIEVESEVGQGSTFTLWLPL